VSRGSENPGSFDPHGPFLYPRPEPHSSVTMSAPRWQRVKDVFQAALGQPAETREAFLKEVCADDLDFKREVVSLLTAHDEAGSFLEGPAFDDRTPADSEATAPLTLDAGTRLGPYEIAAVIGSGGMGDVYRARDVRLGRDVAVKVLPRELAASADRRRRFEREARAASALNHPVEPGRDHRPGPLPVASGWPRARLRRPGAGQLRRLPAGFHSRRRHEPQPASRRGARSRLGRGIAGRFPGRRLPHRLLSRAALST